MHPITLQTLVFVAVFASAYMGLMVHKTARQQIDIYDLVMLSTVAIVPCAFVAFPKLAYWLAEIAGVEFPFVVMFGMLFAVLFVFVHRLTVKLHRLEADNRLLVQELSLLKQAVDSTQSRTNDALPD
jgi:hypothetical protein